MGPDCRPVESWKPDKTLSCCRGSCRSSKGRWRRPPPTSESTSLSLTGFLRNEGRAGRWPPCFRPSWQHRLLPESAWQLSNYLPNTEAKFSPSLLLKKLFLSNFVNWWIWARSCALQPCDRRYIASVASLRFLWYKCSCHDQFVRTFLCYNKEHFK